MAETERTGALPAAFGGISGSGVGVAITDWVNYGSCPGTTIEQLSCLPDRLQTANGILISFVLGVVGAVLAHWMTGIVNRSNARRETAEKAATAAAAAAAAESLVRGNRFHDDAAG